MNLYLEKLDLQKIVKEASTACLQHEFIFRICKPLKKIIHRLALLEMSPINSQGNGSACGVHIILWP